MLRHSPVRKDSSGRASFGLMMGIPLAGRIGSVDNHKYTRIAILP